ncbi:translation initiation factor [Sulfuricurvum sp.]|jgi:translation initiation factor 1|uniref:translation initiation factor n=1 Tax=Sulfuricurvum sp. TaxID=2025608 RepID=UPI00261C1CEC|nr:translation initiation factor [Sulfuricurvum sp.]MDD2838944.1 translation initiation factor [Sulfuricurvum sp.]MDD3595673.1 translation initiation factor [Sulfuricurvum sp.]MDD4884325.1 translation initiation factor [Sulfuricurvum sp.]
MAKGTKISLDFGASWDEGWSLEEDKVSKTIELLPPSQHRLVFRKEKRKGKAVTLVGSFSLSEEDAQKALSTLKKSLACGGAYKEGWMELQGDIALKVRDSLESMGFKFKNPK